MGRHLAVPLQSVQAVLDTTSRTCLVLERTVPQGVLQPCGGLGTGGLQESAPWLLLPSPSQVLLAYSLAGKSEKWT